MENLRCVGCGAIGIPIGITGRCAKCFEKMREEHDLRMRTIVWREQRKILPPGYFLDNSMMKGEQK